MCDRCCDTRRIVARVRIGIRGAHFRRVGNLAPGGRCDLHDQSARESLTEDASGRRCDLLKRHDVRMPTRFGNSQLC